MDLRQYADMLILKQRLTPEEYDSIRRVLGLLPLSEAEEKGRLLLKRVTEDKR